MRGTRAILLPGLMLLLTSSGCSEAASPPVPVAAPVSIIPAPAELRHSGGAFKVTEGTPVGFRAGTPAEDAARYLIDLLERTRGLSLSARPGSGGSIRFEEAPAAGPTTEGGYSLTVSPAGIVIASDSPAGLFYGAVSLWQMLTAGPADSAPIEVPGLEIRDQPRFQWRGLMLDSARHYQSPAFIKRFIDVMALHKLNVLHWHLTDDQAWRLEIERYPKLTSVGAWRVPAGPAAAADVDPATGQPRRYGGFYTQDQVRDIVAYALARHITIVPEFDMPGHASAAIAAYPQLGVADHAPRAVPADWGIYRNLFNVEESTLAFLENVLDEVVSLFPGQYVHIGGDEAVKDQWRQSARVQSRMRALGVADEEALQSHVVGRMGAYLRSRGRRLIGWDEILEGALLPEGGGLPPDAAVMSWRGIEGAVAAATAGHDAVLSPAPTLYFDHRPLDTATPGRGKVVAIEDVYHFDPVPGALSEAQRRHILGVQANIWTEHMRTEARVEQMTFPRAAALAEVAWSPAERIHWPSFAARLPAQQARYHALGVRYARPDRKPPPDENRRTSHELTLCSEKLVLSLEDDAPLRGERATFLVDIMNPCWIYQDADLTRATVVSTSVGQVPFNFRIGDDVERIPLPEPRTAAGELEVRMAGCDGDVLVSLPLAPAAEDFAVTALPPAEIESQSGEHDLCLTFTRASVDPMWVLHSVELSAHGRE